jgi:SAM-dependent methyltransferase
MSSFINFERMYEYRFKGVDQARRQAVWNEISVDIYRRMGRPSIILDPSAGRCEFLNALSDSERWSVDQVDNSSFRDPSIRALMSNIFEAELPSCFFDGVFASNFLEHLESPQQVARFLNLMRKAMVPGGRIAILGPNFRYCSREYFDCADHILALTDVSVAEQLYASGYAIDKIIPRYLPFSFRGILPPSRRLTRLYLRSPLAWHLLGKQFLVVATKEESP